MVLRCRVPIETDIQTVKIPVPGHINFTFHRFFGRAAEKFDRAFQFVFFHYFFDGDGSTGTGHAENIMAAAVTGGSFFNNLFFRDARFLRQSRQGVGSMRKSTDSVRYEFGDRGPAATALCHGSASPLGLRRARSSRHGEARP